MTFLDVGGYRSEIRADFSIGSTYSGSAEWYHPLTPTSRLFIAPQVNASRSPIDLYFKTDVLAAYKLNRVYGGFDIGYAFNRFSELRLGYQLGYLSADRWIGSPLLPTVSGRTGTTRVRYAIDRLDNPIIPRSGIALLADAEWVDTNPGATGQFPVAELNALAFRPVSRPASVYLAAAGGTTFEHKGIGLPQFALGNPRRLAAYGVNEFLTNQYFYFGAGYLHRMGVMPPILGSDIYFNARLEVAKVYGLLNGSQLPKDVAAGVVMQTILGPVLIGGSIGDSGHHKWFFQLGHVF
jgi:NTE family protein